MPLTKNLLYILSLNLFIFEHNVTFQILRLKYNYIYLRRYWCFVLASLTENFDTSISNVLGFCWFLIYLFFLGIHFSPNYFLKTHIHHVSGHAHFFCDLYVTFPKKKYQFPVSDINFLCKWCLSFNLFFLKLLLLGHCFLFRIVSL